MAVDRIVDAIAREVEDENGDRWVEVHLRGAGRDDGLLIARIMRCAVDLAGGRRWLEAFMAVNGAELARRVLEMRGLQARDIAVLRLPREPEA